MTAYSDNVTMPTVLAPKNRTTEGVDYLQKRFEDFERMMKVYEQRISVLEQNAMISNTLVHTLRNALVSSDSAIQNLHEKESVAILLDNKEFMQIMQKAVEQGFCKPVGWQFKWTKKCEAAYFASVASQKFGLTERKDHDGDIAISWKPFERLFGEDNLRLTYNDYKSCKTTIRRKAAIDKLFR